MSLVISTGSNLGDKFFFIQHAKQLLSQHFELIYAAKMTLSKAVDYTAQPDFANQVLEFKVPSQSPIEVLSLIGQIEQRLGRFRSIDKGPRTIDIDILFWGNEKVDQSHLQIPHPRLFARDFITEPLKELPIYPSLKKQFSELS
jgi:2-amino-4-hydroxy-6-hydroxymethyldihydropteridine diphosphokinase